MNAYTVRDTLERLDRALNILIDKRHMRAGSDLLELSLNDSFRIESAIKHAAAYLHELRMQGLSACEGPDASRIDAHVMRGCNDDVAPDICEGRAP